MTADDHASDSNAGKETDFALTMAAKFRSAARAADDLAARCREVARWYAEQVDPELASDVDASAPSIAHAWLAQQRPGQPEALSHPQRVLADLAVGRVLEPDLVEDLVDPRLGDAGGPGQHP